MGTKAKVTEYLLPGCDIELYEYATYHRLKLKKKESKTYEWTKSVTTITGTLNMPALPNWYAGKVVEAAKELKLHRPLTEIEVNAALDSVRGAGDAARDHAGLIGTQAHQMIYAQAVNAFSKIEVDKMDPEAFSAFKTFLKWSLEHNMKPILSEQVVGSVKFDFAGILDRIGTLEWEGKEVKALIDFKTSNNIYPSGVGQLGGYLQAYRETFLDDSIEMCFILNFKRDGSPMQVYPFTLAEMEQAIRFFGNLRRTKAGLDDTTKLLAGKKKAAND